MKTTMVIAVVCAITTGCATYKGAKLGVITGPKNDQIAVVPDGVPYTLTRPVYALTRSVAADSSDPVYTLAVANELDPSQVYSIRLKTAPFTDPDFLVKLGAGGVLSSTTSTTAETLTPAITAIGSFASNLLGAKAFGVFDKTDLKSLIATAINQSPATECTLAPDLPNYKDASILLNISIKSIRDQLATYLTELKTDKEFIAEFHYRTAGERECLKQIRIAMDAKDKAETEKRLSEWQAAEKQYISENGSNASFAYELRAAVQSRESAKIDAITAHVVTLASTDSTLATKQNALLAKGKLALSASILADSAKQLEFFDEMDDVTWRARHVVYLERKQSDLQLLRIRESSIVDSKIKSAALLRWTSALDQERSQTLGVASLYIRAQMLTEFLAKIREKAIEGGRAPATAEYSTIRQELDAVLSAIDAKRAKLMADAAPTPTPKLPPLNNVPVQVVSPEAITASSTAGWAQSPEGQGAAQFVLVLKEAK